MKAFMIPIFNLIQRSKIIVQFEVPTSLDSHALDHYYRFYHYMYLIKKKQVITLFKCKIVFYGTNNMLLNILYIRIKCKEYSTEYYWSRRTLL